MAVVSNFFRFFSIYFILASFTAILAFNINDDEEPLSRLFQVDGSPFGPSDLSRAVYLQKRSLTSTPAPKKAFASSEKKPSPKGTLPASSSTESSIVLKTLKDEGKPADNATTSTTQVSSTADPSSTAVPPASSSTTEAPSSSSSSSSTTTTTTTTTTAAPPSSTTPEDDLPLPTRPANIKNATEDSHGYYNSTVYLDRDKAMAFWVDFDQLPQDKIVVNKMLSDSHRKAATVTLSFDFPFYGSPLRNITIATGGFIYMGDYMHSWLAATQYIAPLMANFDTRLSNESVVRYYDNGTAFVIEWHAVHLQTEKKGGNFSFQTTLFSNGNIVFVYETIPLSVTEIGDEDHPVKVGLSDAYVIDKVIYFIRRKTIYEYHRIDMKDESIGNHTAIYFKALTTCMSFRDCQSCMDANVGQNCLWCDSVQRCSDGLDRRRQEWLEKCSKEEQLKSLTKPINCSALPSGNVNPFVQPLTDSPYNPYTLYPRSPKSDYPFATPTLTPFKPGHSSDDGASSSARVDMYNSSMGVGSVVAVLLTVSVLLGALVWVGYAYKNPLTSSGQLLIKYRPSQWRLRYGEARYTAASVHM